MSILHKVFTRKHIGAGLQWIADEFVEFFTRFAWAFFGAITLAVLAGPKLEDHLISNVFSPNLSVFMGVIAFLWVIMRVTAFVVTKITDIIESRHDEQNRTVEPV